MPIFDYLCQDCGERFEALVRGAVKAACPACQSSRLQQMISMFAMSSESIRQANIAKARKASAKARRDAAQAQREAIEHERDHHH